MKTENNYLNFLNETYLLSKHNTVFSLVKLAREHELPYYSYVYRFMGKENFIEKTGNNRNCKYLWKTIQPNIKMAKEFESRFIKYSREIDKDFGRKTKTDGRKNNGGKREGSGRKTKVEELKEIIIPKTINKVIDKNITISFLWGLFKLTITS